MTPAGPPHIGIVAGEASGDALGAGLVRALRRRYPSARFSAVAGPRMRAEDLEVLGRSETLSVMGLAEVVAHLPRLLAFRSALFRRLIDLRPDVVVGIDSPDFNLPLEARLRKRGIPTVHYVSPSVWAWRPKRVRTLARSANTLLSLLPFESEYYASTDLTVRYVGHPMADSIPMQPDADTAKEALGIPMDRPVLAVLPGSRVSEVSRLARVFVQTVQHLLRSIPELHCVVPLANEAAAAAFRKAAPGMDTEKHWQLLDGRAREAMTAADGVLCASGTVTLEALLLKRPMVVAYRVSPLTRFLLSNLGLLRSEFVSLPNLLAGRAVVDECLQERAIPEVLGPATLAVLQDSDVRQAQISCFRDLHGQLLRHADERSADAVAELL